jgi:hypothetical protein
MRTTILAYVIALGGVAMIALGLWGLYILITERASELRLKGLHTNDPNNSCRFCLNWHCASFAAVASGWLPMTREFSGDLRRCGQATSASVRPNLDHTTSTIVVRQRPDPHSVG